MEHMVGERNLSRNTQASYRDTLAILLPFVAQKIHKPVDQLQIDHLSSNVVRRFLIYVEEGRKASIETRNVRLAAIHSFASFVGEHSPEHIGWCTEIRSISFKKSSKPSIPYLEKNEMDAMLAEPDQNTAQGFRDYTLLCFLYNTGARADEAAHLIIADLELGRSAFVKILGKGRKTRLCPLWKSTMRALRSLVAGRPPTEPVFLNRHKEPLTRFGIRSLVKRYASKVASKQPSIQSKRVTTHTIRHTTAVHLLRAGVDINTIRGWLGHVSLNTTNVYAEVDLEMKAKALAHCEAKGVGRVKMQWRDKNGVMAFLRNL
jgi:site-specific recombinase XerD